MKKILSVILAILCCCVSVFACFDKDPDSALGNDVTTVTGGNGSIIDIPHSRLPDFDSDDWLDQFIPPAEAEKFTKIVPAGVIQTAFPFTLNLAFSGFIDESGEQVTSKITRLTLYYYSKSGSWMVLEDIRNPQYEIVSEAEKSRALFGRHTIPSPMGYSAGEYIPVVMYFETSGGQYRSFDLNAFLAYRKYLGAPNFAPGANVLAILVIDNSKPY